MPVVDVIKMNMTMQTSQPKNGHGVRLKLILV